MAFKLITSTPRYLCSNADVATLPTTGIQTGARVSVTDTGAKYIFDGANWVADLTEITVAAQSLNPANDTVTAGFYGATTLSAVDADLAVGNIKTGVDIFGFVGTYDTEAGNPIAAGAIPLNKVGFVNGAKVTGTNASMVDTSDATAVAADLASGKTAYVNGVKITGP